MTNPNEIGCTVLIDGHPINDGCISTSEDVPTVLSGLRIEWGRRSTVDQPQASTCVFDVSDPLYGERLVPVLTIGRQIDVRVDTVIYPDPTEGTIPDLVPTPVAGVTRVTVAADGSTAGVVADGYRRADLLLPPLPFSSNPFAWDSVPRSLPGQEWRFTITITPPAPWAGYSGWAAEVAPVYFTRPDGAAATTGEWVPADTTADVRVTPPPGVWLGLAVHLWPVGPAWDQLDGITWQAAGTTTPVPAGLTVTAFGDSITAGTWLSSYTESWTAKLEARLGVPITNRAVGGAALHSPGGDTNLIMAQVTAALAAGQPAFDTAVILAGTNDLMTHDTNTVNQSAAAAQAIQDTLAARGVRVIWVGILPMGYGSSHADADVPVLLSRRIALNNQLRTMAGTRWVDTDRLFGADQTGFVRATTTWLIDGLHPNPTGTTQMADSFPIGITNPAWTGYHPTWDELATFTLSGFQMLAPTSGAAGSALVFSGRITDISTSWDGGADAYADVQVIAQDWLAELANRYVGDTPWESEPLADRAQRIVSLSGQPVRLTVDPGVAALPVSYRDVDRQPAAGLLQQLALTCGGVLWTATHLVTGQVMRIEDIGARPAALTLSDLPVPPGIVRIVPSPTAIDHSLPITACVIDADPVRFQLDMTDTVSMVAVNWLEQTVDGTSGQLRPTQRTVEVVDPVVMSVIGARRLSVSTQLIIETDADIQARNWLSRSSVMAWRIEGLRWDTTGELDPDGTQTVLTLLDGTLRNGLPIVLTDLPPWMDALTHGDSAALYVEGGTYSYNAGAWELELTTSSATGSAAGALPWQNLEPGWSWDEFDPTISWLDLYGCSYPAE